MKWTRDMPTGGGWYWVRRSRRVLVKDSFLVWVRHDLKYVYSTDDFASLEHANNLDNYADCEWAGPLAPPQ